MKRRLSAAFVNATILVAMTMFPAPAMAEPTQCTQDAWAYALNYGPRYSQPWWDAFAIYWDEHCADDGSGGPNCWEEPSGLIVCS